MIARAVRIRSGARFRSRPLLGWCTCTAFNFKETSSTARFFPKSCRVLCSFIFVAISHLVFWCRCSFSCRACARSTSATTSSRFPSSTHKHRKFIREFEPSFSSSSFFAGPSAGGGAPGPASPLRPQSLSQPQGLIVFQCICCCDSIYPMSLLFRCL